jgi:hypothetical protein
LKSNTVIPASIAGTLLRQISAGSDLYRLAPFWLQKRGQNQAGFQSYVLQNQQIALGDYSPEKAGVGGSTPSLATMFSIACIRPQPHSCSILFQKTRGSAGVCLNSTDLHQCSGGCMRQCIYYFSKDFNRQYKRRSSYFCFAAIRGRPDQL